MWKKESERRVEESERKEESWGEKEKVYQTIRRSVMPLSPVFRASPISKPSAYDTRENLEYS